MQTWNITQPVNGRTINIEGTAGCARWADVVDLHWQRYSIRAICSRHARGMAQSIAKRRQWLQPDGYQYPGFGLVDVFLVVSRLSAATKSM